MGKQWKQGLTFFVGGGSKITADDDCSHEIERHLLLGRKVMTNLDSILKSRAITLWTKVQLVKALVLPVVMYRCESWAMKKGEWQIIDAPQFELWCWRRLLSPLDCKEIQPVHPKGVQSWVFIERTDIEAETPVLWPPHAKSWLILKTPWCWERLRAGEGDNRGLDCWMASPTQCTWVWVNSKCWWCTGRPGVLWFMGSQRIRHDWATELKLSDAYRVCL